MSSDNDENVWGGLKERGMKMVMGIMIRRHKRRREVDSDDDSPQLSHFCLSPLYLCC